MFAVSALQYHIGAIHILAQVLLSRVTCVETVALMQYRPLRAGKRTSDRNSEMTALSPKRTLTFGQKMRAQGEIIGTGIDLIAKHSRNIITQV